MIEIDVRLQVPRPHHSRSGASRLRWNEMERDRSFFFRSIWNEMEMGLLRVDLVPVCRGERV